ncbi:hypothetical protein BC832DRAFT_537907 [Gaertneriomyces semiglobifer]|nr:hypothetical protein BC832DRAFT_537907 [Gaertneriomyces semiglobifer]
MMVVIQESEARLAPLYEQTLRKIPKLYEEIERLRAELVSTQQQLTKSERVEVEQCTDGLGLDAICANDLQITLALQESQARIAVLEEYEKAAHGLRFQLDDLNRVIAVKDEKLKYLEVSVETLTASNGSMERELTVKNENLRMLEDDITTASADRDLLRQQLADMGQTVQGLETVQESLTADKTRLEAQLTEREQKIQALESSIQSLLADKTRLEEELATKEQKLHALENSVETLNADKNRIAGEYSGKEQKAQALVETLVADKSRLERELADVSSSKEQLIASHQKEREDWVRRYDALGKQQDTLRVNENELKTTILELKDAIRHLPFRDANPVSVNKPVEQRDENRAELEFDLTRGSSKEARDSGGIDGKANAGRGSTTFNADFTRDPTNPSASSTQSYESHRSVSTASPKKAITSTASGPAASPGGVTAPAGGGAKSRAKATTSKAKSRKRNHADEDSESPQKPKRTRKAAAKPVEDSGEQRTADPSPKPHKGRRARTKPSDQDMESPARPARARKAAVNLTKKVAEDLDAEVAQKLAPANQPIGGSAESPANGTRATAPPLKAAKGQKAMLKATETVALQPTVIQPSAVPATVIRPGKPLPLSQRSTGASIPNLVGGRLQFKKRTGAILGREAMLSMLRGDTTDDTTG